MNSKDLGRACLNNIWTSCLDHCTILCWPFSERQWIS